MPSHFSGKFLCFISLALYISSAIAPAPVPASSISVSTSPSAIPPATPASAETSPAPSTGLGLAHSSGNTGCFAYFNAKDGCASANPTNNCRPKVSTLKIQQFVLSAPSSGSGPAVASSSSSSDGAISSRNAANVTSSGGPPPTNAGPNTPSVPAQLGAASTLQRRQGGLGIMTPAGATNVSATAPSTLSASAAKNATSASSDNSVPAAPLLNQKASSLPSASGSSLPGASSNSGAGSICGVYDAETELGVCLYSGSDATGVDRKSSGWVSTSAPENCKKEVVFQRTGSSAPPVVARVVDGCGFETSVPSIGCTQIYLTKKAFMALNPSSEEISTGVLKDSLTWDFNSKSNPTNLAI